MKTPVTFLGPVGATFSHDAYNVMAQLYNTPNVLNADYVPATHNGEILDLIIGHGGYGSIAMETRAEGRVTQPLESFISMLGLYNDSNCPITIIGALKMELHFCLMVRPGIAVTDVSGVVAHSKSLGACKNKIAAAGFATRETNSNGEATRLVAEDDSYATYAALGPRSAAEKYGLQIVDSAYEDSRAVTMFFLIGPAHRTASIGERNRALIMFRLPHHPNALVEALKPFGDKGLNLVQIHSVYVALGTYDFAIEVEMSRNEISSFGEAMRIFERAVVKHITFGPFQVLS